MLVQIATTVGSESAAIELARVLIKERLAACVQTNGPIVSIYRWDGKIEQSNEWRVVAKTLPNHREALIKRVSELHSYDVPEVLVQTIEETTPAYLSWAKEQVG